MAANSPFQTNRALTPLAINTAVSGDNVIVPAIAGQRVEVYRIMWSLAAGTMAFKDGVGGTAYSGPMTLTSGVIEDMLGQALFVTSLGNGFVLNLGGANQFSGTVWYRYSNT